MRLQLQQAASAFGIGDGTTCFRLMRASHSITNNKYNDCLTDRMQTQVTTVRKGYQEVCHIAQNVLSLPMRFLTALRPQLHPRGAALWSN